VSDIQMAPERFRRRTRVLIVDDIPEVRTTLRDYLASDPELCVCGEAGNGVEAIVQARRLAPDVVSMNINMPEMDGLTATALLTQEPCGARVLIYSVVAGDPSYLLGAVEAGAILCLEKFVERDVYVQAIKTAAREPPRRRRASPFCSVWDRRPA